jgi:flagellar biosynthesis/type III secretory pathway chaperone
MIDTLIAETENLTSLIEAETDRLLRERPSDLTDLMAAKDQHAQHYLNIIAALRPLKSSLASAPETMRARLRTCLAALDAALLRNGDVLLRLQTRSKDFLETIASALNPHTARPHVYGTSGATRSRAPAASIALNATV